MGNEFTLLRAWPVIRNQRMQVAEDQNEQNDIEEYIRIRSYSIIH